MKEDLGRNLLVVIIINSIMKKFEVLLRLKHKKYLREINDYIALKIERRVSFSEGRFRLWWQFLIPFTYEIFHSVEVWWNVSNHLPFWDSASRKIIQKLRFEFDIGWICLKRVRLKRKGYQKKIYSLFSFGEHR